MYKYFSLRKNLVFEKNPTNQPLMYVFKKFSAYPLNKHSLGIAENKRGFLVPYVLGPFAFSAMLSGDVIDQKKR